MSQRIAVVMGGRSSEHEISLKSGEQVMKALAEDTPLRVVIGQDGGWTIDGQRHTLGSAIDRLTSEASVVFLALHGAFDHVLEPSIPGKGELLTQLTFWWFDQLDIANHLIHRQDVPDEVRGRENHIGYTAIFARGCGNDDLRYARDLGWNRAHEQG